MKTTARKTMRKNGSTILVVMGFTTVGAIAVASIMSSTTGRVVLARRQFDLEQAFYLAEAGAERAVSRIAGGNESSGVITGPKGAGTYWARVSTESVGGGEVQFEIHATGTVHGVSRGVRMQGVRRVSWARYALWYDKEATKLWIPGGEKFNGPVYARPQFHFHSQDINTPGYGQAHFYDRTWTAAKDYEVQNKNVKPIFDIPLRTSAPIETTASIEMADLQGKATKVLTGNTTIELDGTTMYVTNANEGEYVMVDKSTRRNPNNWVKEWQPWNRHPLPIPNDGKALIYVKNTSSANKNGNINVSGPKGLGSRLTLVAENDIKITGDIKYKNDPSTKPNSTDALGLIAQKNVSIEKSAPNDVWVFAHIIARDGGFGVTGYDTGTRRGVLNVYGGIVNDTRNAVGTVGKTGYIKNYIFDKRFAKLPPPHYPVLTDELEWTEWQG